MLCGNLYWCARMKFMWNIIKLANMVHKKDVKIIEAPDYINTRNISKRDNHELHSIVLLNVCSFYFFVLYSKIGIVYLYIYIYFIMLCIVDVEN